MFCNTMHNKISLLALLIALLLPTFSFAGVPTEVVLNRSILLNLQKPVERVSVATPSVAEVIVISPRQIQVNGARIGATTLIVWEQDSKPSFFDITVKGDTAVLEDLIREVAPNDAITVTWANDTIVLSGKATNEQTIAKVVQVASTYALEQEQSAGGMGLGVNGLGVPGPGGKQIGAAPPAEASLKILNHITIDAPEQVLLEVKVAQVDKTALKALGISALVKGASGEGFSNLVGAPDSMTYTRDGVRADPPGLAGDRPWLGAFGPLAPYQLGAAHFGSGIGAVLRALSSKNLAKLLAEPNVLVASGKEGKFLAGTKFPVSVLSSVGGASVPTIEYINVGVKLYFRAEVMANGLILLNIDPAEVSSISGTLPVNGYPIIDTREIRTSIRLRDGESLVLGGLLQEEAIKRMSKIPLLGDIPILGALFRSTESDIKEKELVFFITPNLVKPEAPGTKAQLPTDVQLTPEQEKEFQWMPLGQK
jgi:pilus assembly protein CpaC